MHTNMNLKTTVLAWALPLLGLVMSPGISVMDAAADQRPIPAAYGPNIHPSPDAFTGATSYTSRDRIVATYYFYWYCVNTREHIVNGDGTDALTDHPPTLDGFSYNSVKWHKQQLLDMMAAGIDVALPVFWGAPPEQAAKATFHWSYVGLERLVQARQELLDEGRKPPRIGMFYDTSTLQHNGWGAHVDLRTDYGREWFYATIRDFFSLVPPRHWAMIDSKPVVLLYAADFAKSHDQSFIDHTRKQFAADFGGRVPWIAAEVSWKVEADSKVVWGGALGTKNAGVASVGPGYDHSAVPGRTPLICKRDGGRFYEENWTRFLRQPSNLVVVETWNEFHEGTDVADSREYGRQYIKLTRKYADLFKKGWKPGWPKGEFSKARSLGFSAGAVTKDQGLRLVNNEDGRTAPGEFAGSSCLSVVTTPNLGHYLYFAADNSFKEKDPVDLTAEIEYCDGGAGILSLEYCGSDVTQAFHGGYTPAPEIVRLEGAKIWKTARFTLKASMLINSQNGGADFRFATTATDLKVRKVTLLKAK